MATGEGLMRIPKGARRSQENAGIDPTTGDFVDGDQAVVDSPVADPVQAAPAAEPAPAPAVEPAAPVVPADPLASLNLTFDDDEVPQNPDRNDSALAALELSKAALTSETAARQRLEEEVAALRDQLSKQKTQADVAPRETEAVGADAMADIHEVLVKPAMAAVLAKVETMITERLGAATQQQRTQDRKTTRARTLDKVYREGRVELGLDVEAVMMSNQFRTFLDTRAPGTRDSVGSIITAAIDAEDVDTTLFHVKRFVESRRPVTDRTIETGAPAATGPSVVRGGTSSPTRKSRAALQAQFNEARRARDTETMNRLGKEIDAYELAGLLDA